MNLRVLTQRVARRLDIDNEAVYTIVKEAFNEVVAVLETEEPVSVFEFGEWYFDYSPTGRPGFVSKAPRFRFLSSTYKLLQENRIEDIGVRTSVSTESKEGSVKSLGVRPSDIPKLRRAVQELKLDKRLRLRRLDSSVTVQEVCANLTYLINNIS